MRSRIEKPPIGGPRPPRRPMVVILHALLVVLAYAIAYLLRFEFTIPDPYLRSFLLTLPALVVIRMIFFWRFRVLLATWRYVSLRDVTAIAKAIAGSAVVFAAGVFGVYRYGVGRFPRSVVLLDALLCLLLVIGVRAVARERYETRARSRPGLRRRSILVGAGEAGEALLRGIEHGHGTGYEIVGIVDDDRRLQGRHIHGVAVVGTIEDLPEATRRTGAEEILLAIPSATTEERQRVIARCRESGVPVRSVPALTDLLEGTARINQLEDIVPEDLLEREPVKVDAARVSADVAGRVVLVSGAGGSIGSELCHQLAALAPRRLVLYERAESALYWIDLALREKYPDVDVVPVVGDVLDARMLNEVFAAHEPALVYHAAAYKHVPLMEAHPIAAMENNVFGTETLALTAAHHGVERFVLISTDKAVRPVGVMGMTKRVAEDLLRSMDGGTTRFIAVRFGNVLGSAGSVLPLFQAQIARGGPVTVTDPEAQRYFMLIAEAAQLVLQAGSMGRGGEVFYLDMGQPVRILELAENLIRLAGKAPGRDVSVETVGLRPGERLSEELTRSIEEFAASEHDKVLVVKAPPLDVAGFRDDLEVLRALVSDRESGAAVDQLQKLASSY